MKKTPNLGPTDAIISSTPTESMGPGFDPKPKDKQLWENKHTV